MTAALCLPQQTSLVDRRRSCQVGHGGFLPLRALRSEPIGLNTWNALESSDRSESVRAIRCGWLRSACSTTFAGATAEFSPACASSLVVGENFACGRGRHGNVQRLQTLGAQLGFEVRALTFEANPIRRRAPLLIHRSPAPDSGRRCEACCPAARSPPRAGRPGHGRSSRLATLGPSRAASAPVCSVCRRLSWPRQKPAARRTLDSRNARGARDANDEAPLGALCRR